MKSKSFNDLKIGDSIDLNNLKLKIDTGKIEVIGIAKIEVKNNKLVAETTYFKDKK